MTARRALPGDGPDLARLRWAWRVDDRGETPGATEAEFRADFIAWLEDHISSHLGFVVEVDGEIVGEAWLLVFERVPGPAGWRRLGGHVQSVYVVPAHRDRGIGAELMNAVIDHGRELGLDYIVVHPSQRAFTFYRRLGFAESAGLLELNLRNSA